MLHVGLGSLGSVMLCRSMVSMSEVSVMTGFFVAS